MTLALLISYRFKHATTLLCDVSAMAATSLVVSSGCSCLVLMILICFGVSFLFDLVVVGLLVGFTLSAAMWLLSIQF